MRFWSPFHTYSLDIISNCSNKLILRAPNRIRLRMTVDHLELNENPGSCLTHYNHDTCLWECYHSPYTIGHHRLFVWVLDSDNDDQWSLAVRFTIYIEEKTQSFNYPLTTDLFNKLRCQLITPMNGTLLKESLPIEIIIRIPNVRKIQLQIGEQIIIKGKYLLNDIYRLKIPSALPDHIKNCVLMGLCFDDMFYSILITYKIE